MGYSAPNIGFERQRNLGGGVAPVGTVTITSPTSIEGSSVTITWTMGGDLADTFRITLGTTPDDAQIADSGEVESGGAGRNHYWTFRNLEYTTTTAYLTIRWKFGDGAFQGVQRKLPINIPLTPVDDVIELNWDDSTTWDDSTSWTE